MDRYDQPPFDTSAYYLHKQKRAAARAAAAASAGERQMWAEVAAHWQHMADRRAKDEQAAPAPAAPPSKSVA